MQHHAITFNGRNFVCQGYRYENLADAVAYRKRAQPIDETVAFPGDVSIEMVEIPKPEQRSVMRSLAVRYRLGYYFWGPYRYERLRDALDAALRGIPSSN